MEAIGLTSSALSGMAAAFKVAEIGFQLRDVREDSQTFIRLVKLVEDDLEHALACRADVMEALRDYPDHYRKWIVDAIRRTIDVLDDFGQFVLEGTDSQKLPLERRILYLLRNYPKLVDREKALSFAHTSLLATINFMHLIAIQGGVMPGSSERLGVPSPSNYCAEVKRASGQRPRPQSPASMSFPPSPDPTPPATQGSMIWEPASSFSPRSHESTSARQELQRFQQLRQRQSEPTQFR